MTEPSTSLRLNKALAQSGLCARRKADELIFSGAVSVNGEVVREPGRQVDPARDHILVHGQALSSPRMPCHLLLHKPVQVVSTVHDPEGRTTVLDLVPQTLRDRRLYPVGRLDYFSEGLILLTDDGELAHRLSHPRHHIPRRYRVRVRGLVPAAALNTMRRGMILAEGERLAGIEVTAESHGEESLLHMTLYQGVNRQIRRMCRDLGLVVLRLVRVGLGPLELGDLPSGGTRPLSKEEVSALFRAEATPPKKTQGQKDQTGARTHAGVRAHAGRQRTPEHPDSQSSRQRGQKRQERQGGQSRQNGQNSEASLNRQDRSRDRTPG